MKTLSGKRILIVEDDFLIGAMVTDMLTGADVAVVGPARNASDAMALAMNEPLDAAILDVNLRGQWSDGIAAELQKRNIPFVVATGYGAQLPRQWTDAPVIGKPFTEHKLLGALSRILAANGNDQSVN